MKSAFMLKLAEHISFEIPKCRYTDIQVSVLRYRRYFRGFSWGTLYIYVYIEMIGQKVLCHWQFVVLLLFGLSVFCWSCNNAAKASITASVHLYPRYTYLFLYLPVVCQ